MQIESREYKVMVEPSIFADREAGLEEISNDFRQLAANQGLEVAANFAPEEPKLRRVCFLDTPDFSLRANRLLLRQGVKLKSGKVTYTLKCRNEDRYIAAGQRLSPSQSLAADEKFEEDIGVPFVSRFSHSATLELPGNHRWADHPPTTLDQAAELFPDLLALRHDEMPCRPETALTIVNGLIVDERVYQGPVLWLPGNSSGSKPVEAEIALILWTKGKQQRILTAELSFRYADKQEAYGHRTASAARRCFVAVQAQDWARPNAMTKTQYMYNG